MISGESNINYPQNILEYMLRFFFKISRYSVFIFNFIKPSCFPLPPFFNTSLPLHTQPK